MALSGFDDDTRRICLCDSEISYGEHLMEYLRHEGRLSRDIYLYTSAETLLGRENADVAASTLPRPVSPEIGELKCL